MADEDATRARKLAVILHADVAGSTALVQRDETLAHQRITTAFRQFSDVIASYHGTVHEVRGDALVAEFPRASDAVSAALRFQQGNGGNDSEFADGLTLHLRVGISLGEVVIADGTVTGPGVVLAQRVEQLAEPNEVCVTAAVREAVPSRLPFGYTDLGLQTAKGFDDPVHVYFVALLPGALLPAPETAWKPQFAPARPEKMAFALPDMPSIAILPFDSFSEEPGDQRLADGFTENLTSVMARIPNFLVTARNSSFRFRGGNAPIDEVAETLSVRYILEGSLQRSGEQLRITAQLIDAVAGTHLWAETFDRGMGDFFKLSDDIALRVARELSAQLTVGEIALADSAGNLDAYLRVRTGWAEFNKFEPEANRKARSMAKQALGIETGYLSARTLLAWTFAVSARLDWDAPSDESWSDAERLARELVGDAPNHQGGYEVLAYVQQFRDRDYAAAEQLYEQALEKNPSNTGNLAMLASATFLRGKWDKTIQLRRKAMRLQPFYPTWYLFVLGWAHVFKGESDEALALAHGGLERDALSSFERRGLHGIAVQAYAASGDLASSEEHVRAILELDPEATVAGWSRHYPFEDPAHAELFEKQFLTAGLPAGDSTSI